MSKLFRNYTIKGEMTHFETDKNTAFENVFIDETVYAANAVVKSERQFHNVLFCRSKEREMLCASFWNAVPCRVLVL